GPRSEGRIAMNSADSIRPAPGPKGVYPFRFLRELRRDPVELLRAAHRQYGEHVRWQVGPIEVHLVFDPTSIEHVLVDNAKNYDKRSVGYDKLKLALGEGLLTSEGDFWRRQRRIVQPAFHRERLRGFGQVMTAKTEDLMVRWRPAAARR